MPISQKLLDDIRNNVYCKDTLSISGEDLIMRGEMIDDKDFSELVTCLKENVYIKNLRLPYLEIGNDSAKLISDLGFLECVEVPHTQIGKIGVQALLKSKTIKHLDIGCLHVEDDWLIGIEENNILETLVAFYNSITSKGAKLISQNTSLKFINLFENPVEYEPEGIESLAKMKSLEDLVICQKSERYIEVPTYQPPQNPPITSSFNAMKENESKKRKAEEDSRNDSLEEEREEKEDDVLKKRKV